ncbi:deoxyguanosine kinase isoform X2 [Nematostella vectensis]|nr:deoxyguanosine kinase isoform X2 [Nematostella vectensis]
MIGLTRNQGLCSSAKVLILEGNIGVGKTTLACQLARKLNYKLFLEPTNKNPYLARFYEDPKRYALKMQIWLFRQRFRMYSKATSHVLTTGQGVLLDRSVFSDCVFADVNYKEGTISEEGYKYYNELKTKALKSVPPPHVMLFVDASPEVCFERIHGRGRDYESGIPLSYLKALHKAYRNMLIDMRQRGTCVLEYDWSHFGYQFEVCKDVNMASCTPWDTNVLQDFHKIVDDKNLMKHTLSLSYTIPEVEFSDDLDDESEKLQEEEKRYHLHESKQSAHKRMNILKDVLTNNK